MKNHEIDSKYDYLFATAPKEWIILGRQVNLDYEIPDDEEPTNVASIEVTYLQIHNHKLFYCEINRAMMLWPEGKTEELPQPIQWMHLGEGITLKRSEYQKLKKNLCQISQ